MKSFEYHPFAVTLTLNFTCPECGEEISTDPLDVPQADMMAERAADSLNEDEAEIQCPNCDWASIVNLYTRYDGGYGEIENLDEDVDVQVDEELPE